MHLPLHNLAALDGDDLLKLILGLVFGLIWVVSAIVSWLSKQHQAERRRQAQDVIDRANRDLMRRQRQVRGSPRRISEGLAVRHPEVLMPPAPPPPLPQQRRAAPMGPPPPIPQAPP